MSLKSSDCLPAIVGTGGRLDVTVNSKGTRSHVLGGLLVRRERWTLSLTAKLLILGIMIALAVGGARHVYSFLAPTERVSGEVLIVEGWVPPYAVESASSEFKQGNYRDLLVIRALYDGRTKYDTGQYLADYIAEQLVQTGIPRESVHTAFLNAIDKDRTYASAMAAKEWFGQHGMAPSGIDIVTLGSHARRSRLLYEKAMGHGVKVGVIATPDRSYNANAWWRSSEGVREVPFEFVAYLYARFFFRQ